MDVKDAIEKRRAYRSFEPVEITDGMISELSKAAQLTCSCFNNQPWRYVFARGEPALSMVKEALSPGNAWAKASSMIIAVSGKKENDCINKEREYYLFDMGMATFALILRAQELGLVAHPIAGFDPDKAKQALSIPQEYMLITLVNVGKKMQVMNPLMSEKQVKDEGVRPPRRSLEQICAIDKFSEKFNEASPKA
jgi:nitroreductase